MRSFMSAACTSMSLKYPIRPKVLFHKTKLENEQDNSHFLEIKESGILMVYLT